MIGVAKSKVQKYVWTPGIKPGTSGSERTTPTAMVCVHLTIYEDADV